MSVTINGIGFIENSQTIDQDYILVANRNAMTAGDIEVADEVTVTVEDGSTWTIV